MKPAHIDLLKNAFLPVELSPENHPEFFTIWEEVSFDRNELITDQGKLESYFYVVESGTQMIYIQDQKGDQHVIGFSFDGSFSGVYDAFMSGNRSSYTLQTITESKMLRTNRAHFLRMFDLYPDFERWGRIVHMNLLIGRVNREVELITLSAAERFHSFQKRCPKPLTKIPQKYIASYLNMTPETYSRLRKLGV